MSHVRPHGNVMKKCLVQSALNQYRSHSQHRLPAAHSGRNLHGLSFLQPVFQWVSQPTLSAAPNSHLQPPSGWLLQPPPAALALRGHTAGTFVSLSTQRLGLVGAVRSVLRSGCAVGSLIKVQVRSCLALSTSAPNPALNLAPFGRWTLRHKAAQRRLALRWASFGSP